MSEMMSNSKLTKALHALASANSKAARLRAKISKHSVAVYGFDPADVDCDEFIDLCDGGCGESTGMTAAEFDAAMRDACNMSKGR